MAGAQGATGATGSTGPTGPSRVFFEHQTSDTAWVNQTMDVITLTGLTPGAAYSVSGRVGIRFALVSNPAALDCSVADQNATVYQPNSLLTRGQAEQGEHWSLDLDTVVPALVGTTLKISCTTLPGAGGVVVYTQRSLKAIEVDQVVPRP